MSRTVTRLVVLSSFWLLGCWSTTDALKPSGHVITTTTCRGTFRGDPSRYPLVHSDAALFHRWGDGRFRKARGIESEDLSDVLWRHQSNEQIQNVFKRFLFHYSKARNSVGALQHESTSVHPLMRLSPKLSQGRKRKFLLLVRDKDT
ncbi:uncharacterized protein nms isoform X1 [Gasterosteus aculeatus]